MTGVQGEWRLHCSRQFTEHRLCIGKVNVATLFCCGHALCFLPEQVLVCILQVPWLTVQREKPQLC